MKPTIYLAFVDDWELSGNGSGDIRKTQFRPMRELVNIYDRYGIRGSFNAEMMQQLSFRKNEAAYPELKTLADEWDVAVLETYSRGHDIQLHIHPQWSNAEYKNGEWRLTGDWSILNYQPEEAYQLMSAGREYLEKLLRPVDSAYRCISYRAGAWCIAPSPHILQLLVRLGIVFDMSIVGDLHYDTRNINLDYRSCEETFLPYYPVMTDARKVSDKTEQIICVPTNHFYGSRRQVLKHHLDQVWTMAKKPFAPATAPATSPRVETYAQEWAQKSHASVAYRIYEKGLVPYVRGKHLISDLAQLDYALLKEMLGAIRRRALASKLKDVPVILENHTKDVHDFSDIERFINDVSNAEDIRCVTLTEMSRKLLGGKFAIRSR